MTDEQRIPDAFRLLNAGDPDAAEKLANQTIANNAHCGAAWVVRGMAQASRGEHASALQALEIATSLVPLPAGAQCVLADCYVRAGRIELARSMYRYLAGLEDLPVKVLPALARGLGQLRDYELAVAVCRQAAERQVDCDAPWYALAYYLRRLGAPAQRVLPVAQRAFELEPGNPTYRVAVALLLADTGQMQRASVLAASLQLDRICCRNCLSRLQSLFDSAGDKERAEECRQRLSQYTSTDGESGHCV